ncbi:glycosyltransferase involved in cell wall biosynthesis [Mucilaginibacter gracilis]|uniref:Glycosyltransferase involved in cell wall biosynthesis n=1 Tax=Mucilaginibacter gracilis TaxID=423350 RepID=A0A495J3Y1_9SPHI|nr:glycosyltransferase family 1 protein [Mucilaginibacter gracilis]RKR83533.1 glycosyltransferase involved in cell wall biosynthesis [Mucilaginibacter gracilis]
MGNKRISLFVDAHSFDTGFQGTQTFIRELYTQILLTYPDLDIYFGAYDVKAVKKAFPSVESDHILSYKNWKLAILRFAVDIPQYIKKYKFDYAHFQYLLPVQIRGCKYIVTTHDVLFNDFPEYFSLAYRLSRNFLFGRSIKNAAIKTTVSNYSKLRIARYYGIPETDIKVIPNGVSTRVPANETARQFVKAKYNVSNYVLYVSRVEPRKNHTLVLKAYLKLQLYKQNIPLVFIGKNSIADKNLEAIIKGLTLAQSSMFHWFPQVDDVDVKAFYAGCKLFVYPSKAEGFGIPPLEAAVCGVPVLCSSATAMSDFDFFKPHVFNPDDEHDFETKLLAMIANPPTKSFLDNITKVIAVKYQWQPGAKLFHDLLTALPERHEVHKPVTKLYHLTNQIVH